MQISIYNRKHWHALSHSLHFVRHEGRLATIGGTRLTRAMAANEPGFLYTRCGTSSSSYRGMHVFRMASPMVISTGPPTCTQDDGRAISQRSSYWGFVFLLFQSPCLLVGFRFFVVYGVVEVLINEVSVRILFASCDSQSIVCPCKLNLGGSIASLCSNYVRSAQSKIVQPLEFYLERGN